MNDELFRREVIDARKASWLGTVRLMTSRLAWPMTLVGAAAMVTLVCVLVFGSVTRKERVQGRVVPAAGLLTVLAPNDGIVTRVFVDEGTPARAGQALVALSTDVSARGQRDGLSATIGSALRSKADRLRSDLDDLRVESDQREQALRSRIASFEKDRDVATQRARLRAQQAANARAVLERVRPLEKQQIVSAIQIQGYESAALEAEASAETDRQQQLDAARQLAEARAQLDALPLDIAARRSGVERELADVSQQEARNRAQGALELRSARAGSIVGLSVDVGDSVRQGQRLLSVIPAHSPLRVELWVPSRAAGALRGGTRVAMRFDAFPFQQYGQRFGHVVQVSGSASTPREIEERSGILPAAPAYRVLVDLDRDGSAALALRAGMTLDADLLLERRRLYALVFEPLRSIAPAASSSPGAREATVSPTRRQVTP